jgi:hypothetical protein
MSLFLAPALLAQSPDSTIQSAASPAASAAEVPRLIKFSGTLLDSQDRPLAGPIGVTFALHAQQTGGAALWLETQNVTPDAHGSYTVLLGANSTNGVPAELFASGEARWLEVQVERQAEQPRILLVSVPYALKAKDAETLGGKPASAFLTTETLAGAGDSAGASAVASSYSAALSSAKTQSTVKKTSSAAQPAVACTSVTSDGTAALNSIALFTAPCTIQSSLMTQALINGFPGVGVVGNNAGMRLSGTGTHQVTVTGLTSGRLGQDSGGFFFASDTSGSSVRFLTNNGTLNEWMRITSAGNVGIGTQTPAAKLDINGNLALPNTTVGGTAGVVTLGGTSFLHNFGSGNTFVGTSAGNMSMTGSNNTGVGTTALFSNTTGSPNDAFGFGALQNNTTGSLNSAFGDSALRYNTTGQSNSAFGAGALNSNTTGHDNAAFGYAALLSSTAGPDNSAFGDSALDALTSGNSNIAIGFLAGGNLTTGSNNIYIGNTGAASESNTIRMGTVGTQTATYVAGISGVNNVGVAVTVNSSGQLGTTLSSRRFKDDIADMAGESDLLMKLRPVAFYYKPEFDKTHTRQYGLVAEEVAQVAPELVVFDKDGTPETVRYHFVNAMLLNEVQKQRQQLEVQRQANEEHQSEIEKQSKLVEVQRKLNEEQQSSIARQQAEIRDLAARLAKLEALVSPAP